MEIPVWATTTLHGHLRFPINEPAAKTITVAVESPPQPAKNPDLARGTKFDCQVATDGAWACTVPATTLDLVVRVDGYAPVYRWGVGLTPESPTDLGYLRLYRGASVVAWLDSESAKLLERPATATLSRMIAAEASQTTARLRAPVADAQFNARGVVQLVSLPAGTYVLTVSAKGFAPARAFPIDVFTGRETALRKAVTLERPMTVSLSIRPPKDPSGGPWNVTLRRMNDFGTGLDVEGEVRTRVDADGLVDIPGQTPGSFQVAVADGNRNVFGRRNLDLRDGPGGGTVIDVPLVSVRGKVLLGDEPLPADLWFGGRDASIHVKLTANEDGAFEGALPNDGRWTVQVASRSPKLETLVEVDVKVEDEVIIRLPDTTIEGVVVDPEGGPLDMIVVTAYVRGRPVTIRTERNGKFAFRGLPETTVTLRARDLRTNRLSKSVESTLKAGETPAAAALQLQSQHQVSGRVLSRGAPVVGARVSATAFADANSNRQVQTVSNEDGAFDLDVADDANHAWIVISAPGKTLQNYDVPLTGEPLILDVEPVGGTLDLAWPVGRFPQITRAGVPLLIPELIAWARRHGEVWHDRSLRVPNLAPGTYRLCIIAPAKESPGGALQPQCKEGVLAPAGTLKLDLGS